MNERIQELADKAQEYAEWMTPQGLEWFDNFKQQFAELIVKECVKVMYDNAIERRVPPDIEKTPTHYAVAILEHFGVKDA
jgi:hypothetical protein